MKKIATLLFSALALTCNAQVPGAKPPAAGVPVKATSTPAAEAVPVSAEDGQYQLRQRLIVQMKDKPAVSMGIFPGTVDNSDLFFLVNRYLPLTNFLSEQSGSLVSFVPLKRSGQVSTAAKAKTYDFLYTNAETALDAVSNGYVPLIKRNEPIQGVWLARKSAPLNSIEDLVGKRVGVVDKAMVTTLSRHSLITKGILDKVPYLDGTSAGQNGLIEALKSGVVDAIVVRSSVADRLMKATPDLYKIVDKTESVPGFILLAKKDVNPQLAATVAQGFLGLSQENPSSKTILAGFDAATGSTTPFVRSELSDLDYLRTAVPAVSGAKSNLMADKMK